MKTARFADVVSRSGRPEIHQLWVPPRQDRAFQSALKEQRILTIHQENTGAKKDYGRVGFHEEPLAQYLVFPKSLRRFFDRRIIGINYGLLQRAPAESAGIPPAAQKPATKSPPPARERAKLAVRAAHRPQLAGVGRANAKSAATAPRPERAAERLPEAPTTRSAAGKALPPEDAPAAAAKVKLKPATTQRPVPESHEHEARPSTRATSPAAVTADKKLLNEVKRALKELKAGKAVAAYERLASLLSTTDPSARRSPA